MNRADPLRSKRIQTERASFRSGWAGLLAVACLFALGVATGCSGGGGDGGGVADGGHGDATFEDASNVVDERYIEGEADPDGTASVPHVVIIRDLPGGDPALDQVSSASDLGD